MSKEKKDPAELYKQLLEENNLVVIPVIQKRQSSDTGAWYDVAALQVDYKKE